MSADFRADLAGIPEQLLAALPLEGGALSGHAPLLLGGMGGSAAAGDFFALYLEGRRDVRVLREAVLPTRVVAGTRLVVLSYSGETEESLCVWEEGRSRRLDRAAVASGGTLLRGATEESCPRVALPTGLAPRNALGYLLGALRLLAAPPEAASDWKKASRHLQSIRDLALARGPSYLEVAELLEETQVPVLLAPDAFTLAAARRWRASLAENAKVAATVWELPEAAHNRIVTAGRDGPRRRSLALLALGTPQNARAAARWDAVLTALEAHGSKPLRITATHPVPWIEALGLAYLGDWMSVELADRLGVDPEPIVLMTDVKSRLRQQQGKDTAS